MVFRQCRTIKSPGDNARSKWTRFPGYAFGHTGEILDERPLTGQATQAQPREATKGLVNGLMVAT